MLYHETSTLFETAISLSPSPFSLTSNDSFPTCPRSFPEMHFHTAVPHQSSSTRAGKMFVACGTRFPPPFLVRYLLPSCVDGRSPISIRLRDLHGSRQEEAWSSLCSQFLSVGIGLAVRLKFLSRDRPPVKSPSLNSAEAGSLSAKVQHFLFESGVPIS